MSAPNMTKEQMVNLLVQRMMADPNLNFMILMHQASAGSLEMLVTTEDHVWIKGVIDSAYSLVDEAYRDRLRKNSESGLLAQKQNEIFAEANAEDKKGTN